MSTFLSLDITWGIYIAVVTFHHLPFHKASVLPGAVLVFAVHLLLHLWQGVRAVIAESFEKLHKNQLVGMGIMPLQFLPDQNADSLELSGKERFTVTLPDSLSPRQQLTVKVGNKQRTLWQLSHTADMHVNCQNLSRFNGCTQDSLESSVNTERMILVKYN